MKSFCSFYMAADVQPICLPVDPAIRNKNFVKTLPFVAGWGATSFSKFGNPSWFIGRY